MRYLPFCVLPLLAIAAPAAAQESEQARQPVRANSTGFEIISGVELQRFELEDGQEIDKLSVPLTARLSSGRFRVTAQVPYVRVSGPGNVVVPSGPLGLPLLAAPAQPAERTTREGIGDARVNLAYDLGVPGVNLALNTGVKLPTASTEKGLGTGQVDYWVGADLSKSLGPVTPFGGLYYTRMGDGDGFELEDTLSGQAGVALRAGRATSLHVGYSYSEAASEAFREEQRVFGGLNTAIGRKLSLGAYGSAGVAGRSDVGGGVSLGVGF